VVTGGSRGIGAATAVLAARRGYPVCVAYRSRDDAARQVVDACKATGGDALAVRADVSVEADVVALFEAAGSLGPLHGLVNNAGVVDRHARLADMTAGRVERMLRVNTLGAILCAREAVRRMSAGAAIVNVSSRAAVLGGADTYVDYAASKAAVEALTVGLAREVAADGIRVNCIRPGLIDTDIHASGGVPDRVERMAPTVPMRRAGTPEEIANAIVWLLSDEASYVTGAVLDVSGGR